VHRGRDGSVDVTVDDISRVYITTNGQVLHDRGRWGIVECNWSLRALEDYVESYIENHLSHGGRSVAWPD
jgi:hypothetical protein